MPGKFKQASDGGILIVHALEGSLDLCTLRAQHYLPCLHALSFFVKLVHGSASSGRSHENHLSPLVIRS